VVYKINRFKFCGYFYGDFLCRVYAWVRKSVKILIVVVLRALLLTGLYALFGEVIIPTLKDRNKEMVNYAG